MTFKVDSTLSKKENAKKLNTSKANILIYTAKSEKKALTGLSKKVAPWEVKEAKAAKRTTLSAKQGPIYLVNLKENTIGSHNGLLSESPYACAKESLGKLTSELLKNNSKEITVEFFDVTEAQIIGSIVGLELALYRYESSKKLGEIKFKVDGKPLEPKTITNAKRIGLSINQARHLVNLPPNELNPVTYADQLKEMYSKSKTIKATVFDEKKLAKENCNLLLSVGIASDNPARIVHLAYRPKDAEKETYALIGKGITFDSGGLDMKSAAGMRLMKKDMGGSACLVGFSRWLENSGIKKNIDIYLALAENAVSSNATRPSDIIKARNGMTVEIHNTDAEGRLALASAIDLALDKKPDYIIDMATLTGAGKVALGQDIGSLFSNDDELANDLQKSSALTGDLMWRMPLYSPYFVGLKSEFADMANSASGHGGAITAALFLEKFVGKAKWAHMDIFGWTSGKKPSLVQKGGSGQGVETLINYFS
ncbi:hypothetical protein A9Q84_01420 [Halobacteriovorax marinus]|uniref:Cytosol aminopeptidase domain-containing protein n=1 Tax=Halobacteriovorax marinus TaxID=97084 RepID=A0A1Y5FBY9_9BACT|nr:hypothetical protein A9Q84_01420 [Halobacteriovorax marinus]